MLFFDSRTLDVQVFDTAALERRASCKYDGSLDFGTWPQSITDSIVARPSAHFFRGIEAAPFCGEWQYVSIDDAVVNPVFLSESLVLGWGYGRLIIFDSGKKTVQRKVDKMRAPNFVYVDPQTQRFVLEETILTGVELPALDIHRGFAGHDVTVFSAALQPLWRRQYKPFMPWPVFALSPGGKQLAEYSDGVVRLYDLPETVPHD